MPEISVIAESEGGLDYEIDIRGENVQRGGDGRSAAEDNDTIERVEDNLYRIIGFTGNTGFGDTYTYHGQVIDFREVEANCEYRVEVDGNEVDPSKFSDVQDSTPDVPTSDGDVRITDVDITDDVLTLAFEQDGETFEIEFEDFSSGELPTRVIDLEERVSKLEGRMEAVESSVGETSSFVTKFKEALR